MGIRIFYEGEAMRIDGHLLTGEESLSCNIDPKNNNPYLLITGAGFVIRIDKAEEKNYVINFYLKKIKDPALKVAVQNFRTKEAKIPLKIPLQKDSAEIETNIFSPKRIFSNKLIPMTSDEKKELQMKFNFNFKESAELYRYEYKGQQGEVKAFIPKELLDKGAPSLTLMQKAFLISVAMGIEQGTGEEIVFTLEEKLRWLGYTKEDLEKNQGIYSELKKSEMALFGMSFIYDNKRKGKAYRLVGIHPYSSFEIRGEGKGTTYSVGIDKTMAKGINFEFDKRKALNRPVDPPYKSIPIELITNRKMSKYEKNVRMKALEHINQPLLKIEGEKLLSWAGAPDTTIQWNKKNREARFKLITGILEELGFRCIKIDEKNSKDFRGKVYSFIPPRKKTTPQESKERIKKLLTGIGK